MKTVQAKKTKGTKTSTPAAETHETPHRAHLDIGRELRDLDIVIAAIEGQGDQCIRDELVEFMLEIHGRLQTGSVARLKATGRVQS